MKTSHVLEVTAHPYSLGNPRVYHAKDYIVGATVMNSSEEWIVKEFSGVLMFVCYEGEAELIRMAQACALKPSYKVHKVEGKVAGYFAALKYNNEIVWQATEWCMWRNLGPNSAEFAARAKIVELKNL